MPVRIQVKGDDLLKAPEFLGVIKKGAPRAMARAINRTLVTVRVEATKAVREELNVKAGEVRKTFTLKNASPSRLTGTVISSGREIPLYKFSPKPAAPGGRKPPGGASVLVKRSEGRKTIDGSFVARMRSGHKGLFKRLSEKRFPIEELFGPAIPDVLSEEPTQSEIENQAQDLLVKRFRHEVNYLLSKAAD